MNSDALGGAIRNPIQQEEVVGRAFSGSVCSLPILHPSFQRGPLQFFEIAKSQLHQLMRIIVRPEENLILEI